jgi:phosphoribosyl 1,2-cyclic phosphate phosphodiesterase
MTILLTGSGAADGIPAFFGTDRVSTHAREFGGRDRRLRASAVVDGTLRIDFGPDTFAQASALQLDPSSWTHILFTHSHDDHFAPRELQYMFPPFVNGERKPEIFGNGAILNGIRGSFEHWESLPTTLTKSFETVAVGEYIVTPIRAYHKLDEDSQNLIIKKGDKTLLYATDTGVWQQDTWSFLPGCQFDAVVMECTDGFNPTEYWGHLSCSEMVTMVDRLRELGCISGSTPVLTTHHSASGDATHAELEAFLARHGITAGYDGLRLEF